VKPGGSEVRVLCSHVGARYVHCEVRWKSGTCTVQSSGSQVRALCSHAGVKYVHCEAR